jgi:hypothetical protein
MAACSSDSLQSSISNMPTPSLILVPARFKTGKLYTPVATTSGGVVLGASGDFNVTRATTATRVNASGLIESVASGVPRLDYYTSGGTAGCPALLVEPSAVNSALQSAAWNVSPWAATSGSQGATVSGNVTTSPDGTTNADKLVEAAVPGIHICQQTITLTNGTTYTASFFVKASERTLGRFRMTGTTAYWDIEFNLTLGTATGGTNTFIQNYGNGWYRIGATFTANTASNVFNVFLRDASGNVSYTGDGTSGFFVYGAQVEVGSVATSYIPTTTGSITRNADVISVSGAVSGCIGQTEGVLYIECESNIAEDDVFFINRSTANGIALYKNASNAYIGRIFYSSSSILFTSSSNITGMVKIAIAYKSGDSTMYLNGSRVGTLNTTAITFGAALNSLVIDKSAGFIAGIKPNRIRAAALYTTRLTDAELQALTT